METIPLIGVSVWLVAKIFVLLFLGIYIVFGFVVIKQINLMLNTIDVGFSLPIRFLGWAHLLFSIGVFVLALIIL